MERARVARLAVMHELEVAEPTLVAGLDLEESPEPLVAEDVVVGLLDLSVDRDPGEDDVGCVRGSR